MGSITIYIPQSIKIEYTLNHASMTQNLLDMLNRLFFRTMPAIQNEQQPVVNGLDGLFADEPELIDQITDEAMQARATRTTISTVTLPLCGQCLPPSTLQYAPTPCDG